MRFAKVLMVFSLCLTFMACDQEKDDMRIEATGTIQKQGITTYQYGTHVISGYALRSSTIDLDEYVDSSVTVVGHLIEGYPVEGGPDYLEVEEVK